MGQFDGRVFPDLHPGGDAGENGALSGANGGAGPLLVAVLLQIQLANQAQTGFPVGEFAFQKDHGILQLPQAALFQVLLHGLIDFLNLLLHVLTFQLALRQDQPEGGGGVTDELVYSLPIFRLGGVLVAGHHGPFGQAAVLRQQDVGRGKGGFMHRGVPPFVIVIRVCRRIGGLTVQRVFSSAPGRRRGRQAPFGRILHSREGPDPCLSGCHRADKGRGRRRVPGWR